MVSNLSVGRRLGHSKASLTWVLGVTYTWRVFLENSRGFECEGDVMRVRSNAIVAVTAIIATVALSACGQFSNLKARKAFKDANADYQAQRYEQAAVKYQEVVAEPTAASDPNLVHAYFFLGNSYDNMYKPARKGEAENDALLA